MKREVHMKNHGNASAPVFALLLSGIFVLTTERSYAQWVQQTSITPENLVSVVMLDSTKAIAVGDRNGILRTTDAGSTWVNESAAISAIYHWNAVSFFDPLRGTIVGDHRIVTTTDGGLTWKLCTLPVTQKLLSVLHAAPGYFYVGADSGWMSSTSDTGTTWTTVKISAWPIRSIFRWWGTIMPGGPIYHALTPYSICSKPVNPTPDWNEVVLSMFEGLGSEAINAEFCKDGNSGFIVGVFGDLWSEPAVLRKGMSDTAWNPLFMNPISPGVFRAISAPSASVIYIGGSSGMVFKTTNGGDNWTSFSVPTSHSINALSFWNEKRGFAVGDSGLILYTSNGGGVTSVRYAPDDAPDRFSLSQNYPNPFNPSTIIKYRLPVSGLVSLRVFDMAGREVTTLVDGEQPAGTYTAQWNGEGCASGVYICRLQAGSLVNVKKLMLLK